MDELYIQKVLDGDTDAFRYFVQQYKDMAYNMAFSILKSEFAAKDAVQDSFIIAFRKLGTFSGKAKFSSWFSRIVINESLKMVRKEKLEYSNIKNYSDTLTDSVSNLVLSLNETQQKHYIDLALQRVHSKEALALNLFYLQEKSLEEISQVTGWTLSNAKVILHRARKSMYAELDNLLKTEKKLLY